MNVALTTLALFCMALVVLPNVHTGFLMTLGLAMMAVGCLAAIDESSYLTRAFQLLVGGNLAVVSALVWHYVLKPRVLKFMAERNMLLRPPHLRFPFDRRGGSR